MSAQKPRAIVFGAGGGGRNYTRNHADNYDFLVFCDNDPAKHDTTVEGIEVVSPARIPEYECDCIIVASMFAHEIRRQLLEDYGVPESKMVFPTKGELKHGMPFMNEATRELGREIIMVLSRAMEEVGVDLFLDYGTLLGIVRDGDILAWDDDIDLSVNEEQFERALETVVECLSELPGGRSGHWKHKLNCDYDGSEIDIELSFKPEPETRYNRFDVGIRKRIPDDDQSVPMGSVENLIIPREHFESYEIVDLEGQPLKVPHDVDGYLKLVYGDWRTPRPGVRFIDYEGSLRESHVYGGD